MVIQLEIMLLNLSGLGRYLEWTDSEGKNGSEIEVRESKNTNGDDTPESVPSS